VVDCFLQVRMVIMDSYHTKLAIVNIIKAETALFNAKDQLIKAKLNPHTLKSFISLEKRVTNFRYRIAEYIEVGNETDE